MESQTQVLVADDDAAFRALVVTTLHSEDYRLLQASDGNEAWALWQAHRPHLAILDIRMAGRSGLDLLRAARADPALAATRVILLTGATEAADVTAGLAAGADAYLTKPFSPLQLLSTMQGLLGADRRTDRPADRLYWALIESAPEAILVVEAGLGRYVVANSAAEHLLGRPRTEILQLRPVDLISPEDQPRLEGASNALRTAGHHTQHWRFVRGDGSIVNVEVRATQVQVDGHVFYQGICRNLNELDDSASPMLAVVQDAVRAAREEIASALDVLRSIGRPPAPEPDAVEDPAVAARAACAALKRAQAALQLIES